MFQRVFSTLHNGENVEIFDLTGRVVMLTGSTGYLGRAMAHAILVAGADLIMIGRQESTLTTQRDLLSPELRRRCHISACDVTHTDTPCI